MKPSVRAAFVGFTAPLEGVVPFMYLDVKGLVTTAIGNLIDPVELALSVPFQRPDGCPATPAEIREAWHAVKARQDLKMQGGMAFRSVTTLRLTPQGIEEVVFRKLDEMDAIIVHRFYDFETWPADAQLGILSMAWAMGPRFSFPRFEGAVRALDFDTAAAECKMREEGNPGLRPRNLANRALFENAARVLTDGLDPDVLYYPDHLAPTAG